MNLSSQRKVAARLLKCGVNRVQFNPERLEEVSEALTREDLRYLISSGAIKARQVKGISRGRIRDRNKRKDKGRRRGSAHRTGNKGARTGKKTRWINKIRAIRDELRKMREDGKVSQKQYRKLYSQAGGNLFNSRRHLREQVERLSQ